MVAFPAVAVFVVHFFPTGQGKVIGDQTLPAIRIYASPRTVRTMGEHIDIDTTWLRQRAKTTQPKCSKAVK